MNLYNETKFIMKKYGIYANKNLGQNFLIDEEIVNKIIQKSNVSREDLIIEIGPGLGTLTKELLENAGKVIAIELDTRMMKILEDRFSMHSNFKCINKDVLKVDLNKLISEEKKENIKKAKIIANLPYYITTPIIMKLLEEKLEIETITVMVQKEVADRLVAVPGEDNTSAITYAINYYTNPTKIEQVPNTSFIPIPKVNSTVIQLKILKKPKVKVANEEIFFKIIKQAFMQKRKTLVNSLANSNIFQSKQQVEYIINKLELDSKIRAEKLSIEDFAKISDEINKL